MADARASKVVRLKDIARRADISVAAASMALADHPGISGETKRRVLELSRKLGYRRVARPSRRAEAASGAKRFGFMLLGDKLDGETNGALMEDFMAIAASGGCRMEVAAIDQLPGREQRIASIVAFAKGLDGLLLSGLIGRDEVAQIERESGVPCLILGQAFDPSDPFSPGPTPLHGRTVCGDDLDMGRLATAWLISKGHRRIAFISEVIHKGYCHDLWLAGYRLGLLDAGVTPEPRLLHVVGTPRVGAASAAKAFAGMTNPPTAYLIPDIRISSTFVAAMRERGVTVSRDSLVMGGTIDVARRHHMEVYPLIGPDIHQMARVCIEQLIALSEKSAAGALAIYVPMVTHSLR